MFGISVLSTTQWRYSVETVREQERGYQVQVWGVRSLQPSLALAVPAALQNHHPLWPKSGVFKLPLECNSQGFFFSKTIQSADDILVHAVQILQLHLKTQTTPLASQPASVFIEADNCG